MKACDKRRNAFDEKIKRNSCCAECVPLCQPQHITPEREAPREAAEVCVRVCVPPCRCCQGADRQSVFS